MQGEKIDPKGLEIIVSYLECRWVFFFFSLFYQPASFDCFCFCVFSKSSENPGKIGTHESITYMPLCSLEGCILIQWKFTTLLLTLFARHQPHFDAVPKLSLELELFFFTLDFSSSGRQLWPNLFLTHTSAVIAVTPLLPHRPKIC